MIIFILANIANFASFAFAAQSLLAALGSIQFVSNVFFATLVNKEPLSRWIIAGTLILVTGCIVLVVFGSHESPSYTAQELMDLYERPAYIAYLSVAAVVAVSTYILYKFGKRIQPSAKWDRWLPILYALFSAVVGTQSVLYGKSMSLLFRTTFSGDSQLGSYYTWIVLIVFLLTATFWLIRFNKALKMFPVSVIMPVLQVGWLLLSMLSGALYFQELEMMGTLQRIMFGVGTCVLLLGVVCITSSSNRSLHSFPKKEGMEMTDALSAEDSGPEGVLRSISCGVSGLSIACLPTPESSLYGRERNERRHTISVLATSYSSSSEADCEVPRHGTKSWRKQTVQF